MIIALNTTTTAEATDLHIAAQNGDHKECVRLYQRALPEDRIIETQCCISIEDLESETNADDSWVRTPANHCFKRSMLTSHLDVSNTSPMNRSYLGKMVLANLIPWKQTPMHYAIASKHEEIVSVFLSKHDFSALEIYQLMQFAAFCSNQKVSKLLYDVWEEKGSARPSEAHYTPAMIALMRDKEQAQFWLKLLDKHELELTCPEGKVLFCYLVLSTLFRGEYFIDATKLLQHSLNHTTKKLSYRYALLLMDNTAISLMNDAGMSTSDNCEVKNPDTLNAIRLELAKAVEQGDSVFVQDLVLHQTDVNLNFFIDSTHILEIVLESKIPEVFKTLLAHMQKTTGVDTEFTNRFFDKLLGENPEERLTALELMLEFLKEAGQSSTIPEKVQLLIYNCLTHAAFLGKNRLLNAYRRSTLSPKVKDSTIDQIVLTANTLNGYLQQNDKSGFMDMLTQLNSHMPSFMTAPMAFITIMRDTNARSWVEELVRSNRLNTHHFLPQLLDYAFMTYDTELFNHSLSILMPEEQTQEIETKFKTCVNKDDYSRLSLLKLRRINFNNFRMAYSDQNRHPLQFAFLTKKPSLFKACCENHSSFPIEAELIKWVVLAAAQQSVPEHYIQLLTTIYPINTVIITVPQWGSIHLLEYSVRVSKYTLVKLCLEQEGDLAPENSLKIKALNIAIESKNSALVKLFLSSGAFDPFTDAVINTKLENKTLQEYTLFLNEAWLTNTLCEYAILQGPSATNQVKDIMQTYVNSLNINIDGTLYSSLSYAVKTNQDWLFDLCIKSPFPNDYNKHETFYHIIIHGAARHFNQIVNLWRDIDLLDRELMNHAIIENKMFILKACTERIDKNEILDRTELDNWAACIDTALINNHTEALSIMAKSIRFTGSYRPKLERLICALRKDTAEVFNLLIEIGCFISPNHILVSNESLLIYALKHNRKWLIEACFSAECSNIDEDKMLLELKYAIDNKAPHLFGRLLKRYGRLRLFIPEFFSLIHEAKDIAFRSEILMRTLKITNMANKHYEYDHYKNYFWSKVDEQILNYPLFDVECLSIADFYVMSSRQINIVIERLNPSWKKAYTFLIHGYFTAAYKMAIKTLNYYFFSTQRAKPKASPATSVPPGSADAACYSGESTASHTMRVTPHG